MTDNAFAYRRSAAWRQALAGLDADARFTRPHRLGTANLVVDGTFGGAALVALIQVTAIVVGHVLAVVLAHDRAVRLLPHRHAVVGQLPMLLLMVGYTVGGLALLFAG
jgi:hypothetical protein